MQTSVSATRTIGREGANAQTYPAIVLSRKVEDAAGIKPGRFVKVGTGDRQATIVAAAADVTGKALLGVSLWTEAREPGGTNGEYTQNQVMPVMRKGVVWMYSEDAVSEGGSVYVRHTAGVGEEAGKVRSDADGGDADIAPNCTFRSTTTTAGYVLVEVNLPG